MLLPLVTRLSGVDDRVRLLLSLFESRLDREPLPFRASSECELVLVCSVFDFVIVRLSDIESYGEVARLLLDDSLLLAPLLEEVSVLRFVPSLGRVVWLVPRPPDVRALGDDELLLVTDVLSKFIRSGSDDSFFEGGDMSHAAECEDNLDEA